MTRFEKCANKAIYQLTSIGIAMLGILPLLGYAQVPSAMPKDDQWGAPEHKQLIEEVIYTIKVRRPVVDRFFPLIADTREAVGNQECGTSNPEQVVRDWLVRMSVPSYTLALKCWDNDAQTILQQMDKKEGKSPSAWQAEWSKLFSGNRAVLTARIDFGPYVLIEYRIAKGTSSDIVSYETVTLRKSGERWLLTLAAVGTTVASGWNGKNLRTQRVFSPNSISK